jgi:hypothetical protein
MNDIKVLLLLVLIAYGIIMFLGGYLIAEWFYGWMMLENYQNQMTIHEYGLQGRLCMALNDNQTMGVCPEYFRKTNQSIDLTNNEWQI